MHLLLQVNSADLQHGLQALLPLLCQAVTDSGAPHAITSAAIITHCICHVLRPEQWLPVVQRHLDLVRTLQVSILDQMLSWRPCRDPFAV